MSGWQDLLAKAFKGLEPSKASGVKLGKKERARISEGHRRNLEADARRMPLFLKVADPFDCRAETRLVYAHVRAPRGVSVRQERKEVFFEGDPLMLYILDSYFTHESHHMFQITNPEVLGKYLLCELFIASVAEREDARKREKLRKLAEARVRGAEVLEMTPTAFQAALFIKEKAERIFEKEGVEEQAEFVRQVPRHVFEALHELFVGRVTESQLHRRALELWERLPSSDLAPLVGHLSWFRCLDGHELLELPRHRELGEALRYSKQGDVENALMSLDESLFEGWKASVRRMFSDACEELGGCGLKSPGGRVAELFDLIWSKWRELLKPYVKPPLPPTFVLEQGGRVYAFDHKSNIVEEGLGLGFYVDLSVALNAHEGSPLRCPLGCEGECRHIRPWLDLGFEADKASKKS